jgi:hypothetical protein
MIKIYDGNNYYRLLLETDFTGLAPRTILTNFLNDHDPVIWVWDGKGGNARRRALYDGYKRNRQPLKRDITVGFDLLEEMLRHTKAIQVKVPGFEGDDVVASLTRHYAKAGEPVSIYSNDFDFSQLTGEFPGLVFCGYRPKDSVPPYLSRYYKICVGDASDNIPGIKGFGQKTWDETDKKVLVAWVDDIVERRLVRDIGLPPRIKVNIDEVQTFAKIIDFFTVPMNLISQHMTVGKCDYAAADALLKEYLQ